MKSLAAPRVLMLLLLLLEGVPSAWVELGFDAQHERDYNIFNPVTQFAPDTPLNPINKYQPDNPFNPRQCLSQCFR